MDNNKQNDDEIAVLFKLQKCKQQLQQLSIKKSGHNKYGHYDYYELEDIIPPITSILIDNNLCSKSYQRGNKMYLTIYDLDSNQNTSFNTKLKEFPTEMNMKKDYGTYMKNQQGLQTYARRALWLMALDIVEPNDIETDINNPKIHKNNNQKTNPTPKNKPTMIQNMEVPHQTPLTVKNKLVKSDAPVTTDKIKEILDQAYEKVTSADLPFTIANADFTIKRLCNNQNLYKACIRTLESKTADDLEGVIDG